MSWADIKLVVTGLYAIFVAVVVVRIIAARRDPVKSLAWITVIALVPVVGVALYFLVGQNLRSERKFELKLKRFEGVSRKHARALDDHRNTITLLLNNSEAPLTVHNRITVLNNGKATFASLIEALKAAKETINIEYYIFENDRIGRRIAKILKDKARGGVEVRFIYDDVGSWGLSPLFLGDMRRAGIEVRCFQRVVFPWLTSKVNYRNHRKIVVVDGKVAFTGGINIADRYLVRRGRNGMWRDTHLRLAGEAAAMLQTVFLTDWYFLDKRGRETADFDPKFFPPTSVRHESPVQIAASGPDSDWDAIMQAFFSAITRAHDHIYISSPYFLPNQAILTALKVAALGGVDVRVMIPSRSDSKIVYWATRSYISELLDAGIKVYMYMKGFNHSKVIMIDGRFSSVGTANMDMRSFEDNFEVSAIMYDADIAAELEGYFAEDLRHSRLLDHAGWSLRPRKHKAYEALARLLSPLL